jgi:CubicO group peptidase (beta-lactamase class C family)
MKIHFLLIILLFNTQFLRSQNLYFPPLTGNQWDTVSPASLGWCVNEIDSLYDYLETNNSKAFIVLKDGRIAIEKYFGSFTHDSLWYWASAGKTITAFLTGIAQQEGHLSIYDTTATFLGNGWTICPPDKEEEITIRHQLNMTSGLDDGVPEPHCTLDTCLQYLADAGTRWAYHNAPYTLLDGVLNAATGLSLNVFLALKLKNPTGMDGFFAQIDYNKVYFSKARSMARFGLLVLAEGSWAGNPVMTDTEYFQQMINTSQELNKSYGYLWWLNGKESFMLPGLQFVFQGWMNPNAPEDMIAAMGKNGQVINVVPSQNLVFIRMGNAPASGEIGLTMNDSIWYYLNHVICDATGNKFADKSREYVKIFPNPATDILTVIYEGHDFDLALFDLTGREISTQKHLVSTAKLNVSGYQPGIYLLKIVSGQKVYTQKVVIVYN